jgi:hypothetical protein
MHHSDFDLDFGMVGGIRRRSRRSQFEPQVSAHQGDATTTQKVDPEPPERRVAPAPSVSRSGPGKRTKPGRRAPSASTRKQVDGKSSARPSARSRRGGTRTGVAREPAVKKELARLAKTIRGHHEKCCGAFRTSLEHAIKVGTALASAKKKLGHGKLERWIETECKFRPRTARDYMKLAQAVADGRLDLDELKRRPAAVFSVKAILKELREPRSGQAETSPEFTADAATHTAGTARPEPARESADRRQLDDRSARRGSHVADEPAMPQPAAMAQAPAPDRAADEPLQDVAVPARDQPSEPDDAAWLATLKLRSRLADPATFDRDALLWRPVQPAIAHLRRLHEPTAEELMKAGQWVTHRQRYSLAIAIATGTNPPSEWTRCKSCKGSGEYDAKTVCLPCGGGGYFITHAGDELKDKQAAR